MQIKTEILDFLTPALNSKEKSILEEYFECKSNGFRKKANSALTQFITNVNLYPIEKKRGLVYKIISLSKEEIEVRSYGSKYSHKEPKFDLNHLIIENLIAPILIDDVKNKRLGSAKELSRFSSLFYKHIKIDKVLPNEKVPEVWKLSEYFLEKELAWNSNDIEAAKWLVNHKLKSLNMDIHELPEHGLSVEIDVYEKRLNSLNKLLKRYDLENIFKERVEVFELVRKTWSDYLKATNSYENYQQYLETNKIEGREKI